MAEERMQFQVEDAQLIFRNFKGEVSPFNQTGQKSFSVILDPENAEKLAADGWHVKLTKPRDEEDMPVPYIQVTVNFNNKPPRVIMITNDGKNRTPLDDTSVGILDWADIRTVDLIATAYPWTVGDKSGVKAYLKTMFVTIEEDDLERKYAINSVPGA